jgi:hypothetical protein
MRYSVHNTDIHVHLVNKVLFLFCGIKQVFFFNLLRVNVQISHPWDGSQIMCNFNKQ